MREINRFPENHLISKKRTDSFEKKNVASLELNEKMKKQFNLAT